MTHSFASVERKMRNLRNPSSRRATFTGDMLNAVRAVRMGAKPEDVPAGRERAQVRWARTRLQRGDV